MQCTACKQGSTAPGTATVSVDKEVCVVVIRNVPAEVCSTCGEQYLDASTIQEIEKRVAAAQSAGLHIAVQEFKAAQATHHPRTAFSHLPET